MAKIVRVERFSVREPVIERRSGYEIHTYPAGPHVRVHLRLTSEESELLTPLYTRAARAPVFGVHMTWGGGRTRRRSDILVISYLADANPAGSDNLQKIAEACLREVERKLAELRT